MRSLVVVTLFPEMFEPFARLGVTGRALQRGRLHLSFVNPRDYAEDKHHSVDDRPYGGGPGMVMTFAPLASAIAVARTRLSGEARVLGLSPQGKPLHQRACECLAGGPDLVLLCGRYEGIDERLIEALVDEEWSIGDYVVSGGEVAAMVIIDAVARLLPGVLGHADSAGEDSFASGILDCAHYTRPEEVEGRRVPEVLLSGDHEAIRVWRLKQGLGRTWLKRPDLLPKVVLDDEKKRLLDEFIIEYGAKST